MKTKDAAAGVDRPGVDRRRFLKTLGNGAAGSAAVAAGAVVAATDAAEAAESAADKVKKRYRDSDHVKTFYRVNRY